MYVYRSIILFNFYSIKSFVTACCELQIDEVCYLTLTTKFINFLRILLICTAQKLNLILVLI